MKKQHRTPPTYGNFTISEAELLSIEESERGLLFSHVINLADIFPDKSGYAWALFYQPTDSLYYDVLDDKTNQLKIFHDAVTLCGAVSGFRTNKNFTVPTLTENHVIPKAHLRVVVN